MTENERKRIEDEAEEATKRLNWLAIDDARKAYIAGATHERNLMESELKQARNAVIDECIESLSAYRDIDRTQMKEVLRSLSINPN